MGVKELAIPALAAAGGAGAGAGGAYATGNYLSQTSVEGGSPSETADQPHAPTSKTSDVFKPSSCFNQSLNQREDSDKWFLDIEETVDLTDDDVKLEEINPQQGCLTLSKSGERDNFELVVLDGKDLSQSQKGVVIWSIFSKVENNFSLVSRLVYLNKDSNQKWTAIKGLEFSSLVQNAKISVFEQTIKDSVGKLCKEDGNCSGEEPLKHMLGKRYVWKSVGQKNQSVFDYVKVIEDPDRNALFFGRDFSFTNVIQADIKAVYRKGEGWKKIPEGKSKPVTDLLFKASTKGTWKEDKPLEFVGTSSTTGGWPFTTNVTSSEMSVYEWRDSIPM